MGEKDKREQRERDEKLTPEQLVEEIRLTNEKLKELERLIINLNEKKENLRRRIDIDIIVNDGLLKQQEKVKKEFEELQTEKADLIERRDYLQDLEFAPYKDAVTAMDNDTYYQVEYKPEQMLDKKKAALKNNVFAKAATIKNYQNDDYRYKNKFMLLNLHTEYKKITDEITKSNEYKNDKELRKNIKEFSTILDYLKKYSEMDITHSFFNSEQRKYDSILDGLNGIIDGIQQKTLSNSTNIHYENLLRMTSNLMSYFENQKKGDLEEIPDDKITINTHGEKIRRDFFDVNYTRTNNALFPHDPSFSDIKQADSLGDCYLVSSLSSIAIKHPDKIKEAMRDNGDGTVTVRFWQKKISPEGQGHNDYYEPIYVKVDKITPALGSADGSMWVQMMERAYAASGLYLARQSYVIPEADQYARPTPPKEELERLYKQYSDLDRSDWPSHEECPWLIDGNGNLHKYEPSYSQIQGGHSSTFIEHLLGPDYPRNDIEFGKEMKVNSKKDEDDFYADAVLAFVEKERKAINHKMTKAEYDDKQLEIIADGEGYKLNEDIYHMLTGTTDPFPTKVVNGETVQDISFNENAVLASCIAHDISKFGAICKREIRNKQRQSNDFTGISKFIKGLLKDDTNWLLKNGYRDKYNNVRKKIFSNPALKEKYANLAFKFDDRCIEQVNRDKPHPQYDGHYNGREKEIAKIIDESLFYDNVLTFGTKEDSKGDKNVENGMNSQHAYAVTGIEYETKAGKTLCFIKFRNPHGGEGRQYSFKDDGSVRAFPVSSSNGEGRIELSDFVKECGSLQINGMVEQRFAPDKVEDSIALDTISKYSRALESTLNTLKGAKAIKSSSNSLEYKNLVVGIENAMIGLSKLEGKDMNRIAHEMKKLSKKIHNYEVHCKKHPRKDSTRATRLEAAAALDIVCKCGQDMIRNPKEAIQLIVAKKISSAIVAEKGLDTDEKGINQAARKLLQNADFKKIYGKMNVVKLSNEMFMPKEKILNKFQSIVKDEVEQVNKTPNIEQNTISNEPVKMNMGPM